MGPALVKPSLKAKLTQPGVVSPGSIAMYVNEMGSPPLVPSPMIVTVLVILSSWANWIDVDWKPLPSPRSVDDTWSGFPSSHWSWS